MSEITAYFTDKESIVVEKENACNECICFHGGDDDPFDDKTRCIYCGVLTDNKILTIFIRDDNGHVYAGGKMIKEKFVSFVSQLNQYCKKELEDEWELEDE